MSTDRPAGEAVRDDKGSVREFVKPIPFTAIDSYARRYGITDIDHFEEFSALIRAMDREYISIRENKGDGDT